MELLTPANVHVLQVDPRYASPPPFTFFQITQTAKSTEKLCGLPQDQSEKRQTVRRQARAQRLTAAKDGKSGEIGHVVLIGKEHRVLIPVKVQLLQIQHNRACWEV
jgi:hypothetical protein